MIKYSVVYANVKLLRITDKSGAYDANLSVVL